MPSIVVQCACCGLSVAGLIESAHVPNRAVAPHKTVPLCILCHRAYDIGLLTDVEIEAVRERWRQGASAPHEYDDLVELWTTRTADWSRLHRGAQQRAGLTIRRHHAAKRAWITRKGNQNGKSR